MMLRLQLLYQLRINLYNVDLLCYFFLFVFRFLSNHAYYFHMVVLYQTVYPSYFPKHELSLRAEKQKKTTSKNLFMFYFRFLEEHCNQILMFYLILTFTWPWERSRSYFLPAVWSINHTAKYERNTFRWNVFCAALCLQEGHLGSQSQGEVKVKVTPRLTLV